MLERFLSFVKLVRQCPKSILGHFLNDIQRDTRSITGLNLRNILLSADKSNVEDLTLKDVSSLKYFPVREEDTWKINLTRELIKVKETQLEVEGFEKHELEDILYHICVD